MSNDGESNPPNDAVVSVTGSNSNVIKSALKPSIYQNNNTNVEDGSESLSERGNPMSEDNVMGSGAQMMAKMSQLNVETSEIRARKRKNKLHPRLTGSTTSELSQSYSEINRRSSVNVNNSQHNQPWTTDDLDNENYNNNNNNNLNRIHKSKGTPQSISANPQLMNVISTFKGDDSSHQSEKINYPRKYSIDRDDERTVQTLHSFHTFPMKSSMGDDDNDTCVQSVKSFPLRPSPSHQVGGNGYYFQQSNQLKAYDLQSKQHSDSINNNMQYDNMLRNGANHNITYDYDNQRLINNQQLPVNMRKSKGYEGLNVNKQKSILRKPLSLEDLASSTADVDTESKGSKGSNESGKSRRFSLKRPNKSFGSSTLDQSNHSGDNNNNNLNRIHKSKGTPQSISANPELMNIISASKGEDSSQKSEKINYPRRSTVHYTNVSYKSIQTYPQNVIPREDDRTVQSFPQQMASQQQTGYQYSYPAHAASIANICNNNGSDIYMTSQQVSNVNRSSIHSEPYIDPQRMSNNDRRRNSYMFKEDYSEGQRIMPSMNRSSISSSSSYIDSRRMSADSGGRRNSVMFKEDYVDRQRIPINSNSSIASNSYIDPRRMSSDSGRRSSGSSVMSRQSYNSHQQMLNNDRSSTISNSYIDPQRMQNDNRRRNSVMFKEDYTEGQRIPNNNRSSIGSNYHIDNSQRMPNNNRRRNSQTTKQDYIDAHQMPNNNISNMNSNSYTDPQRMPNDNRFRNSETSKQNYDQQSKEYYGSVNDSPNHHAPLNNSQHSHHSSLNDSHHSYNIATRRKSTAYDNNVHMMVQKRMPSNSMTGGTNNGSTHESLDASKHSSVDDGNESDKSRSGRRRRRISFGGGGGVGGVARRLSLGESGQKFRQRLSMDFFKRDDSDKNSHQTDDSVKVPNFAELTPWLEHCRDPVALEQLKNSKGSQFGADSANTIYDPMKYVHKYEEEEKAMYQFPAIDNSSNTSGSTQESSEIMKPSGGSLIGAADDMEKVCKQFSRFFRNYGPTNPKVTTKKQAQAQDFHKLEEILSSNLKHEIPTCRIFPKDILVIVQLLPGNDKCCDCGNTSSSFRRGSSGETTRNKLSFGSPTYGTLLCRDCAFRHITKPATFKGKGNVLSLDDGEWTLPNILAMIEGGNQCLINFMRNNETQKKQRRSSSIESRRSMRRRSSLLSTSSDSQAWTKRRAAASSIDNHDIDHSDKLSSDFQRVYSSKTAASYRKVLLDRTRWVMMKKVLAQPG